MLSFAFAKRHHVLVEQDNDSAATAVFLTPATSGDALLEVQRVVNGPFEIIELDMPAFNKRLQQSYENGALRTEQTMADLGAEINLDQLANELNEPADLLESADDAPIIKLLNALLAEAIRENASDIHIEPFEDKLVVRLRVDGVLREVMQPPGAIGPLVISRIKVMAKLDIAEKRLPQDGRISLRVANRPVDVRVSTMPSGHGERVVMRLLDKQAGRLELNQIGMDPETTEILDDIIHRTHGIFLVTGPTGSGKTTTLYAALARLNDQSRNIMTVEDPIEYFIDGIAQSQVNTKVDMSFARGLRAILRQDPDVVMVGEIRDLETAQIAIQASLTGHMVFSTLHTNTAVGAITRLRDMGAEPFLLASSVVGVLAQRLVRLLCSECKTAKTADEIVQRRLLLTANTEVYGAVGCDSCHQTGYKGRTAIYELIKFDDKLRQLVHDGASEQAITAHVRQSSEDIMSQGIDAVVNGQTTPEELLRVMQSI